jgi:hypothetical protein
MTSGGFCRAERRPFFRSAAVTTLGPVIAASLQPEKSRRPTEFQGGG